MKTIKVRWSLYLGFLFLACFPVFSADLFEAQVYREGSNRQDFLFDYSNEISREDGELLMAHNYYSPDGGLSAREEVIFRGGELFTHKTEFYDVQEFSLLEKIGDDLEISFRKTGKEKNKRIEYPEGLVFGPTQQDFIIENLPRFKAGEKLEFLLPVPEFTTTTTFTMILDEQASYQQGGAIVLRMETRNFLLRFLVGKNYFVIDETDGRILEIHGPSILQVEEDGKWELVDVDIYFNYID